MKAHKKLILAAALAFASVSAATAQTKIYLVGAQAVRGQTNPAIQAVLDANGGGYTYYGTDVIAKANAAVWTGGNIGGVPVTIKVTYIGGSAGVGAVAGSANSLEYAPFITDAEATGPTSTTIPDPTKSVSGVQNPHDNQPAQIHLGDTQQISTPFYGNVRLSTTGHPTVNFQTLTSDQVGAEAFVLTSTNQNKFTNVTTAELNALFTGSGKLPLSYFTGVTADATTTVYAVGRNTDAGARVIFEAETGIGVKTQLAQYEPLDADGNQVTAAGQGIASLTPWPIETIDNLTTSVLGNSGYSQASVEDQVIGGNTPPANTILIGYAPAADGVTTSSAPLNGILLSYNGVPYSTGNVANGTYSLWSYEVVDYLPTLTGTPLTFVGLLETQVRNVNATVKLGDLKVNRSSDGGLIQPN